MLLFKTQLKLVLFFAISTSTLRAQNGAVNMDYLNPSLSINSRVALLVSQMTLKEKVSQLENAAEAIPRLQIPKYNWWNECLHGVARAGYATVFPQSITVAASFNKDLMHQIGTIISDEARAKHHEFVREGKREIYMGLDFWSPNINIFRDPRWRRGHETYGEDPYLTGELATEFIKGLQGDDPNYLKLVATAKHFAVHSGPEPQRHSFDVDVSNRDLYETYLPAFRKTVQDAKVYSVMGAYNRFRGESCSGHDFLLNQVLRKQWGFNGYVVSDCGAIRDIHTHHKIAKSAPEAAAIGVNGGCDLNCGNYYSFLVDAVDSDFITEAAIDVAVKRVMAARFKLGMFDPDSIVPYAQIPYNVLCSDYNNNVARKAAQESIVLLKNENNLLPLSKNAIAKIAVVGPNADNWESLVGNYHGIPKNPVTFLKGIQNKVEPCAEVIYAEGSNLAEGIYNLNPIPSCYLQTAEGKQGLYAEYFDNKNWEGTPVLTRIDDKIDFSWQHKPIASNLKNSFSVRWTGYLIPPISGKYDLGGWSKRGMQLFLDDSLFVKNGGGIHAAQYGTKEVVLEAGRKYKIKYEYYSENTNAMAKLLWAMPNDNRIGRAIAAAEQADVTVVVLGLSQRLEGESMKVSAAGFKGGDRVSINLPAEQEALLKAVKATGKPVILVMNAGSAIAINWAKDNIDAILNVGYPGEEGGNALADVLFGDYNPAGRLPVTYYKSVDQLPAFDNYDMQGRTYRYFTDEPLFPFGFGLSYTQFEYSDLKLPLNSTANENITVSVTVKNAGKLAGDEVVQLYLTDQKASTLRPIRQLEGFQRIHLLPGQSKNVSFTLTPRQLSIINSKGQRVIESGKFTIAVGGKQPGFTGYLDAKTTQVVSKIINVKGNQLFTDL